MFEMLEFNHFVKSVSEHPNLYLIAFMLFLFICLNSRNLFKMWILYQKLDRGESLPDRLANFPTHPTSIQDYLNSKEKINLFISQSLKSHSCQLTLSADDINNLYLQGQSINKYRANNIAMSFSNIFKYMNEYFYFQIIDNRLLEKRIRYLDISGIDGIATETNQTTFINQDKLVMKNYKNIEWNGKERNFDKDCSDDKFYILRPNYDFFCRLLTDDFTLSSYDGNDNQRKLTLSVTEKITSIEIADGHLTIKVEQ
jgi:hypothetical protein